MSTPEEHEGEWQRFHDTTMRTLERLTAWDFVIFTVEETEKRMAFVQFLAKGDGCLLAEVSVPKKWWGPPKLTKEQQGQIRALGWEPPTRGSGIANYQRSWSRDEKPPRNGVSLSISLADKHDAALLLSRTLREFFGVQDPRGLRVSQDNMDSALG